MFTCRREYHNNSLLAAIVAKGKGSKAGFGVFDDDARGPVAALPKQE